MTIRTRLRIVAGALLALLVLTTTVVTIPAHAAAPTIGSIPECPPSTNGIAHTGNCLVPSGAPRVTDPIEQTPAGVVNGAAIDYQFDYATVGQGPACPHGEPPRTDIPCQNALSAAFVAYDPAKPATGAGTGSLAGVEFSTATDCTLSCTEYFSVDPALQPDGVTLIATVSYAQTSLNPFDAGDPHPPIYDVTGQLYQVVLHLLRRPPVEIAIEADSQVAPGQATEVDVVLTSTGEGATVTLDPPLALTNGLLAVEAPLSAAGPHTIPPGGSKTITFTVTAGDALGLDQLVSQGEAVDAGGVSWPLAATHPIEVTEKVIDAAITFDPNEITLAEDAAGPTPEEVTMHASVENVSQTTLTDVALLLEKPGWQKTNPASTFVPSDVVVLKNPVADDTYALDDLDPGDTATVDIPVIVKDDGHIEWGAIVQYTRNGTQKIDHVEPGKLKSIPKYLTSFDLKPWPDTGQIVDASIDDLPGADEAWNTPQIVKAGESFALFGEVKNLTTDQVVMAELPTTALENITSAVFRSVSSAGQGDVYAAGLPYRETIDPGSTQVVSSFPSTVENETFGPGETFSSRLTVVPKAAAPNEDASYPDAGADNVLTTQPLTASAATMTPPVPPSPNANEIWLGRLAIGYTEGGIKFVKGTSASIDWVLSKIPEIPTMSGEALNGLVNVGSRLVNGLVAVGTELYEMTPEELSAFTVELANDAMHFLLVKVPDASDAARNAIINLTNQLVQKLIYAVVYDPDPGAFWQSLGSFTSQAIGEISVGWLTDAAIAKVLIRLKEARGFLKAEAFLSEQAAAQGLKLEKGLAGIKPGTLITDRMLALGMGITRAQKDYMISVARKWGVNIYARSRGAKAIELIEKGLATVKPYFIKPKSVNDIDKLFLGFEKLESDVVAIRKPNNWETVSSKMDTYVDQATGKPLTPDQRDLIVDRWQKRNKEWFGDKGKPGVNPVENEANFAQSDRYKLQKKSGQTQNLTLETEGNLEDEFEGKAFQVKPTNFQLVTSAADPEALIPQLFEDGWKVIVGDIDLVAITLPSGRVPSVETLIHIYEDLQLPPLNMQHSATLTWLNEGAATAMLKDHLGAAAEPMIEASVSSRLRAVLFDPKMSFENGDYFKKGAQFVHLAGGEINAPRNWAFGGALTIGAANAAHREYVPPSVFPADMNRTAPPTRIGDNGPETLVNGVWVPNSSVHPQLQPQLRPVGHLGAAAATQADGTRLVVGVQTAVNETVPAGTTALPVLSLAQLYPDGSDGQEWFKPGDEVIIDPGTDAAFRTRLVEVGDKLVLADPLPSEVLMGTMVAMVPEGSTASGSDTAGALARTGGEPMPLARLGLLLVFVGAMFRAVSLRRRRVAR